MSRVFITGTGVINASGHSVSDSWQALLAQQSSIGEVSQWDLSAFACSVGAEVKGVNLRQLLPDKKLLKLLARHDVLGLYAADQAIADSGCLSVRTSLAETSEFNYRFGIYVGSPGNKFFQQYDFLPLMAQSQGDMSVFAEHLFEQVHPTWLLKILPNNVLAYTGIRHQLKGPNQNVTNHAVGGLQALMEAYYAIQSGSIDRAIVIAYDVGFEPQAQSYYDKLGLLSRQGQLLAFDQRHDGTVLGEGAAALVLESEQALDDRSETGLLTELQTVDTQSDAQGIFGVDSSADGLTQLMAHSCQQAQATPDVIVAHANGNPRSDISETLAITRAGFGQTVVTGFKWAYGHTLCAAGLMDTVMACQMLHTGQVPGLAGLDALAPSCQPIDVVKNTRAMPALRTAMVVSRGFAGLDAVALLKRHG